MRLSLQCRACRDGDGAMAVLVLVALIRVLVVESILVAVVLVIVLVLLSVFFISFLSLAILLWLVASRGLVLVVCRGVCRVGVVVHSLCLLW
jgi:hypothetical protein